MNVSVRLNIEWCITVSKYSFIFQTKYSIILHIALDETDPNIGVVTWEWIRQKTYGKLWITSNWISKFEIDAK